MTALTEDKARVEREAAVASAMRDLENDIHEIRHMTTIIGELLENYLVEFKAGTRVSIWANGGAPIRAVLTVKQMDTLSFAWNDLMTRTTILTGKFEAACEGVAS